MSQENVEIVRRLFEAGQRSLEAYWKNPQSGLAALEAGNLGRETEEVLAFLHPEVEVNATSFALYGGTVRGHRGWLKMWDEQLAASEDFNMTLHELADLGGGQVLWAGEQTIKWKGSGIKLDAPIFILVTLSGGLIVRVDNYRDREEALEAASPSEQDAHADS